MKRPPPELRPRPQLLRTASSWRRFWALWGYYELLVLLATACIGLLVVDVAAWLALFTMLPRLR